jgi:hypothetical protein
MLTRNWCECQPLVSGIPSMQTPITHPYNDKNCTCIQTFFEKLISGFTIQPKDHLPDYSTIARSFGSAETREAMHKIRFGTTPYEKLGITPTASK